MKVLIVEDEKYMAEALAQSLKKHHYSIDVARDGEEGLCQGLTGIYDIILLDLMLPKMDGLAVLRELRQEQMDTPVILLTARNGIEDKIAGLDSGADDYLGKPFDTGELLARMRALLRRKGKIESDGCLRYGQVELDVGRMVLSCAGKEITLTFKEAQLMELLLMRKVAITPKEMIIERLWGYDSEAEDNHAEVYISFLRKKLAHIQGNIMIETVRGAGYRLKGDQ